MMCNRTLAFTEPRENSATTNQCNAIPSAVLASQLEGDNSAPFDSPHSITENTDGLAVPITLPLPLTPPGKLEFVTQEYSPAWALSDFCLNGQF